MDYATFAETDTTHVTNGGGWLLLAVINAGLAQGKNRRGLPWFLVSLILGPIATVFIVVTHEPSRWDRRREP